MSNTIKDMEWVEDELATADLGDLRLKKRLGMILTSFSKQPDASILQVAPDWAWSKGAYRFLGNPKITREKIIDPHINASTKRIKDQATVLAIQDTSEFNYSSQKSLEGLGPLRKEDSRGLLMHPTLCVAENGVPLGLIDLQIWSRKELGAKNKRKKKPIEEKESFKWIQSFLSTSAIQQKTPNTRFVNVCDREGDIYDLFKATTESEAELLTRAAWNRCVDHPQKYLWDQMQSEVLQGVITVQIPRKDGEPQREAQLAVRYAPVTIKPPQDRTNQKSLPSVKLWAVYLHEESPPKDAKPLSWMLLSTVPVLSFEDAQQTIRWYLLRWTIELYFKALKSCCNAEKHQIHLAERLEKRLAIDCIVAWKLLFLLYTGRNVPDLPASSLFEEHEWKALYCFVHKTKDTPQEEPTLGTCMRDVAAIGGFPARKSDGDPGMMTLWRGLSALYYISETWKLFNSG